MLAWEKTYKVLYKALHRVLLTRGISGQYFQCSNFQTLPSLLLIGLKKLVDSKSWQNLCNKPQNIIYISFY
jgi:hypothetical protein